MEFVKPTIEYAQLWPMFVVFGVACAGVLVEAFLPRRPPLPRADGARRRRPGGRARRHRPGRRRPREPRRRRRPRQPRHGGHARARRPDPVPVGPDPALRHRRRAAVRRAAPRGRRLRVRRPGRRAARHRGGAPGVDVRPRPHRGLPADDVRGRRHDDVPRVQRPADDVRGARGAVAAALPALRAGASSPAAEPGGGAQVLPARRVLLRLLPLRHRADLRLRRVDGVRRDQRGGPQRPRQPHAAARRHGDARRRPVLQGRRRAVPGLDPRRLPGRPDRGHRVHGGRHQGRGVRRDAAALLRRASAPTAGPGSR